MLSSRRRDLRAAKLTVLAAVHAFWRDCAVGSQYGAIHLFKETQRAPGAVTGRPFALAT